MVTQNIDTSASNRESLRQNRSGASALSWEDRRQLSVQALRHIDPITRIAQRHDVSRKFVYQQRQKATTAIDQAFQAYHCGEDKVLFWLPVSKGWLEQLVLSLLLICHSSFRGAMELLDTMFDYRQISLGSIHNLVQRAVEKARGLNNAEDLSAIRVGAHDEIYQAGQPVLVGMDVASTYCYLLQAVEHCDETSWGVHLLQLTDRGLDLDYTIADAGQALRAGQKAAWGQLPCHGDVFHAEKDLNELAGFLARRARGCTFARQKIERKYQQIERSCKRQTFGRKLSLAQRQEQKALALAADVRVLVDWMCQDVLALAGGGLAERQQLYDFIVTQLQQRQDLCPHRIGPVVRTLRNHRTRLLAFVEVLQEKFCDIARRFGVSPTTVNALCEVEGLDQRSGLYWQRTAQLQSLLKDRWYPVREAALEAMAQTPRASSIVENLNSRLRNYFFLRRHIGHGYLDLLRFFLNHRRFLRSERPERVGKSPTELLAGRTQAHWLEMLGYTRFHRN
jgi:hypothetical protein